MAEWNGEENSPNATPGSFVGVGGGGGVGGRGEGRPPGMNWSLGSMYPDRTPLEDDVWFKAFAIVSYSLVFIVSVFGNLLVIVVILCHKQMRSAVNFFLGNLAVADLCVGIFCVLPALFKYLSQYWWLGRVICKMHNFVQCVNYTCSIIILTVISVERYIIISHPLWNKCFSGGWRIRSTVVSFVWLASITYNIPILFSFDLRVALAANQTHYFCARSNNLIRYETYAMVDLTLLYALPLLLMTVVYVRISIILWRSSKLKARTYSLSEEVVVPPQGKTARGRWCSRSPLMWCSRGCRGSVVERGQSPWQESIALKVEGQGEGPVTKRNGEASAGGGGGGGTTVFNQLKDGLHHEWTLELPMHQMEPCVETTKRHPTDDLTLSASASASASSSSSKATPPAAAATTKASSPPVCQPYQLRRLRNLHQPHPPPLKTSNQKTTTKHQQQHPHQQQARPILTTVLNNGRLKHSVVLTTATTTTTTSSGSDCRTPSKVPLALLRRRRVIRLLIAIIVSFAVCTLPNHVRVQYYIWATRPSISYGQFYVPPITMLMFYMNSAINPILYAFISRKFRRAIATIDWRYCWRRLVRGQSTSSARYTLN